MAQTNENPFDLWKNHATQAKGSSAFRYLNKETKRAFA
jgi:hypothetical protein